MRSWKPKNCIPKTVQKFVLQDIGRQKLLLPGGRESSVVHFLDSDTIAHLQGVADRANFWISRPSELLTPTAERCLCWHRVSAIQRQGQIFKFPALLSFWSPPQSGATVDTLFPCGCRQSRANYQNVPPFNFPPLQGATLKLGRAESAKNSESEVVKETNI